MPKGEEQEEKYIHSGRGKWSKKGVPHRGWACVEVEGLGELAAVCEMCESQEIRYAHHMQHPNYTDILVVGCICAGHMEGDLASAKLRDKKMRSRIGKRKRWLARKWKVSGKGNDWLEAEGYRVTVYRKGRAWGATVSATDDSYLQHSRKRYKTAAHAKLAAFDLITKILARD
jgi:hypothetical protein